MAGRVRRVAGAAVVAQVEGQEPGRLPGQLGGHGDPVGVHGEVHERPAGQGDVPRVPVRRYCLMACSMFWPVSGFFSSAVAVGMPLTSRPGRGSCGSSGS